MSYMSNVHEFLEVGTLMFKNRTLEEPTLVPGADISALEPKVGARIEHSPNKGSRQMKNKGKGRAPHLPDWKFVGPVGTSAPTHSSLRQHTSGRSHSCGPSHTGQWLDSGSQWKVADALRTLADTARQRGKHFVNSSPYWPANVGVGCSRRTNILVMKFPLKTA